MNNRESQQDKILAMHEDGLTPREIQNALEDEKGSWVSNGSIYSTLNKFGLKPNQRKCPHCGQHYSLPNNSQENA